MFIEIRDLKIEFTKIDENGKEMPGKVALDGISLDIEKGSFVAVVGMNGSGKSTLAKCFNGLLAPTEGRVIVSGFDTAEDEHIWDVRSRVGMVFQNPDNQLVSSIVEDDVAFGPENIGLEPTEIRRRVDAALKAVDMYDYREKSTHKLSGGQKQRVAIAGVIAFEPECIVLDEPTAMLDPKGRKEIIDTVLKLNKEKGITVILITHFMEEAELADRVLVMKDGKIIADNIPQKVFSDIETIKSAGLTIPQTTDLLSKLSNNGFNVDKSLISADDCANEIIKLIKGNSGSFNIVEE